MSDADETGRSGDVIDDGDPTEAGGADAFEQTLEAAATDEAADTWAAQAQRHSTLGPGAGLDPGATLGRYIVLEKLGEGGMGVVLAAYDPVLDRKVAVKLLKPESFGGGTAAHARDRLVREAQAMAKISHPNVLAVFDAGEIGGRVAIAMEYVNGENLAQWISRDERTWREVLDLYLMAGRGLAAAHEVGLVHRDFKPANVLVSEDGRVRVTDFGLVSASGAAAVESDAAPGDEHAVDSVASAGSLPLSGSTPLWSSLTFTGTLLGTPVYMAPEQHRRQRVDARTDQFAFCVALWEGLYGRRPFEGRSYWELAEQVCTGARPRSPRVTEVPTWVREVVLRGLKLDPGERYPSMNALLAALEDDPAVARKRRGRVAGTAAILVLLAGLAAVGFLRRVGEASRPCRGAEEKLVGVWDPAARAAVEKAFLGTKRSYAANVYARVAAMLDQYVVSWLAAWTDTCEATRVRGEQSEAMLDLRMRCLHLRLGEVRALVDLFGEGADPVVLDKAVQATTALTDIESCADEEALAAAFPLPADPAVRAAVESLGARLVRAKVLQDSGKYAEGVALAAALVEEAAATRYPPVEAEAWFRLGALQSEAGDSRTAEASLTRGLPYAAEAHDSALVAAIQLWLLWSMHEQARFEEALRMRPLVEASVALSGNSASLRGLMFDVIGALLFSTQHYAEARDYFEHSLSTWEQAHGRDDPHLAYALTGLGSTLSAMGRDDEALASNQRALALREQALGPDHPETGRSLQNIGMLYRAKGELELAREYCERALAVFEKSLGPEHPNVGYPLAALASMLSDEGSHEQALRYQERALAIWEATLGADHPQTADGRFGLAKILWSAGRDKARAMALAEQARAALTGAGRLSREKLAEVDLWLGERRGGRPVTSAPAP